MTAVVIDTSVLIDMVLSSRHRHARAEALRRKLEAAGTTVRTPIYALFEIRAAIRQEMADPSARSLRVNRALTEQDPLSIEYIHVDEAFFQNYYREDLPELRAGDLVFVALAKGDGLALITEDEEQRKKAAAYGVSAYRIDEYLAKFGTDAP